MDGGLHCAGVYGAAKAVMNTLANAEDEGEEEIDMPSSSSSSAVNNDLTGAWTVDAKTPMGPQQARFDLRQNGTMLSGTITLMGNTVEFVDGKVEGDSFSFVIKVKGMKAKAHGSLEGDRLVGTIKVPIAKMEFTAVRAK